MSRPVTVELPDPSWEELSSLARSERCSVGEVGARLIDEGIRQLHFPNIEFRTFNGERLACVKGALQVWQLIMVAKPLSMDVGRIAAYLNLPPEHVLCGLRYYEQYPHEIDQALSENDRGFDKLKEIHPNSQRVAVDLTATSAAP